MKANTHSKLGRLAGVAARSDCVEGELAKETDGKGPEEKPLTCAGWEVIQQRSAEKGQLGRESASQEYQDSKAKPEQAEQDRPKTGTRKRPNVARNLAGMSESSFGEAPAPTRPATDVPLTPLLHLQAQLAAANGKEPINGTKANAPNAPTPLESQSCLI